MNDTQPQGEEKPQVTWDIETVASIAKICHEANRAYCQTIGDDSQDPWEYAPDWQRASVMEGVKFHLEKDRTPGESHTSWMNHKIATGWVWGPVKDEKAKTHPAMMPYEKLPLMQRAKDHLFRSIVHGFKQAILEG